MERVSREARPGDHTRVRLWAARGEYEPVQIAIRACNSQLTNVAVSVSDLQSPGGSVIARSHATLYREHYVHVNQGSPDPGKENRPLGAGWYPDALIPFRDPNGEPVPAAAPFNIAAEQTQPVWIDFYAPRDVPAGPYEGTITITSDQGTTTLPVTLTVRSFELPLRPSLRTSFGMHEPLRSDRRAQELLLEHKIMPTDVAAAEAGEFMDRFGLSTAALRVPGGANRKQCTMTTPPAATDIAKYAARFPANLDLYIYPADEIDRCPNIFETVREWARTAHAADVRVKLLLTVTPTPVLLDDGGGSGRSAVDMWVLLPIMYDKAPAQVVQAMRKGDEIWSYTALVQDSYSPKWQIDFDPINYRIQPGFISASLGLKGLLYWRVDLWSDHPWTEVGGYSTGRSVYPGEGMLVYPGADISYAGVVPSMRLKYIREGIEDYEYVQLAAQCGRGAEALDIARSVGADWKNWTRDATALQNARRSIGDLIEAATATNTVQERR